MRNLATGPHPSDEPTSQNGGARSTANPDRHPGGQPVGADDDAPSVADPRQAAELERFLARQRAAMGFT